MSRRSACLVALISLVSCLAAALVPGRAGAQPFTLGFFDVGFTGPQAPLWLSRSASAGANIVRIDIGWVAPDTPQRPGGFDALDPGDPHYDFTAADAAIRQATADGLRVLAEFSGAPRWAEGPDRPLGASPGSWRPSPSALHDYGAALGRRYSGRFPDPLHPGSTLPAVAGFQLWNEPNLDTYLSPQYAGTRPVAPSMYRAMLNAFYSGVKATDPRALVVSGGTAPFGDPPGGQRTPPVDFWRGALCLTGSGSPMRGGSCGEPLHADVIAHHPYSVGPPTSPALNAGDVSIPDLGKLTRLLRAAERAGLLLPRERHPLWVTETSYDSRPPDPQGVPLLTQAHWLEQALAELWRGGASTVFWNQVGDEAPVPSYAATAQSGVYFISGAPKPALTAYRFPLVSWPAGAATIGVWGRSPAAGEMELQGLSGGRWVTLRRRRVSTDSVFELRLHGDHGTRLRARVGAQISLVWP